MSNHKQRMQHILLQQKNYLSIFRCTDINDVNSISQLDDLERESWTIMELTSCSIQSINTGDFADLGFLESLEIADSPINNIEKEAFLGR